MSNPTASSRTSSYALRLLAALYRLPRLARNQHAFEAAVRSELLAISGALRLFHDRSQHADGELTALLAEFRRLQITVGRLARKQESLVERLSEVAAAIEGMEQRLEAVTGDLNPRQLKSDQSALWSAIKELGGDLSERLSNVRYNLEWEISEIRSELHSSCDHASDAPLTSI